MSKLREKLASLNAKQPMIKKAGIVEELEQIGTQKIGYAIKDTLLEEAYGSVIADYSISKNITIGHDLLADEITGDIARLNFLIQLYVDNELAMSTYENLKEFYDLSEEYGPDVKQALDNYVRKIDQIANVDQLDFQDEFETAYDLIVMGE